MPSDEIIEIMAREITAVDLDPADLYQPPSPLADAIQQPLYPQERWQTRVLNGYYAERRYHRAMIEARQ